MRLVEPDTAIVRTACSAVADRDDDLALRLAVGELPDRLSGAVERIGRGHVRAQLAVAPPPDQLFDVPAMALWLPADERAPEDSDDVAALEQRQVQRDRGDLAGRESDNEEATLPGGGAQRRLAVLATDRVVHDVGAGAAGQLADPRLEVLGGVVDGHRGPVFA